MKLTITESQLQKACVTWFRIQYPNLRQRLFAIPNGGSRALITGKNGKKFSLEAIRMKAEGMLPGVPDMLLAVPKYPHGGLFLEMKSETGRLSPEQKAMIAELSAGYKVDVCWSLEEFQKAVNNYLNS
jgi:hypothetical protein